MRKIATSLFMSLDGIVDADAEWQFPYLDDETFAALTSGWSHSDAVLLGRRTLDGFDDVRRSSPDSPVVGFLSSVERFVVSSTDDQPSWLDTTVLTGDVSERVAALKHRDGQDILVIGSPSLVRWLIAEQLLDQLAVVVLPVLARSGNRMFPAELDDANQEPTGFTLTQSETMSSGAVHLIYEQA